MDHGQQSYSQRKRSKMDYRAEYFRNNPGLFGCIWSCAYCHKPLLGKHNVQVDHIVPLNSPFGMNTRFNLVASCHRCNLAKSDNVDFRIPIGYTSKLIEVFIFTIQKIIILAFVSVWWVIQKVLSSVFVIVSNVFRYSSTSVKLGIIGIIILIGFILTH